MESLAGFMGESCFKEMILHQNLFHMPCLRALVSKFLSFGIVAGALVYKVPQILKIAHNRSAKGVALLAVLLELLSVTISFSYNFNKGFPFMTYGEAVFVAAFDLVIICQILTFEHGGLGTKGFGGLALYAAATYALLGGIIPMSLLQILQGCVIPIIIASRVPQIWENFNNKSTGQLSFITWFLNFAGSAARIFTTLQEVNDALVLLGFIASALLNGIIVCQIILYWKSKGVRKSKAQPTTTSRPKSAKKIQ